MKKAIIISIVIFISVTVKSQGYQTWSDPIALTDSSSFNSNPETITNGWGETYMFYEKRQSQTSISQIWWKIIPYSNSDEQLFISDFLDYDCRNPKVKGNFLIFECNASGNYDLYGIKFNETGTIGNSFKLTDTEHDENSFYHTPLHPLAVGKVEGI